jgi:predicted esterase
MLLPRAAGYGSWRRPVASGLAAGGFDRAGSGEFGEGGIVAAAALAEAFTSYRVHSSRLILIGFSDGASYARSMGLANGDLFTHIIAFSPGFLIENADGSRRGPPGAGAHVATAVAVAPTG